MPQYSLNQISDVVKGHLSGYNNQIVKHLLIDSRGVAYPSESIFFAIKGVRHNGHQYLSELYTLGVRSFVVEYLPIENFPEAGFILVDDSLKALQQLAGWHRQQFHNLVVAITGSNGKTIVKEWIFQAIHTEKHVARSPKSFNSQVGVPLSVWQIENQHDIAIIEAGISMPGEMEKLETIIRPDIGIFTNLGEPHQENFTDYRQKCEEKLNLFRHCKQLIYCSDYPYIEELLESDKFKGLKRFTWSQKSPADIQVTKIEKGENQTRIHGLYQEQVFQFSIPFIDDASVENSLHVASFMLVQGYSLPVVSERLARLVPVAMRLELKQGINNSTIINDTYNSDLGSLSIALDALSHQHQHPAQTVILSDILQSGRSSDLLYAEISKLLKQKNITRFIGIGPELYKQQQRFGANAKFYLSTNDFLDNFHKGQFGNESILLKGSRSFEFERILKVLEEKAHETVLEINLNAMVHNLNYFRSKLKPGTKIVTMVKAFSYGSGSFEIANILQFQRVDYLAVAFADEGVDLRESGITMPIMVMNPEQSSFDLIIRYQLEPEIFSFKVLQQFSEAVESAGESHYPIHLKIDTGMHRLGFMEDELDRLLVIMKKQEALQIKSIFSHLAGSDEAQFDDFTHTQLDVYERMSTKICAAFPHKIIRHILNSAGIERFSEFQHDMVRLGIGLYGLSAVDQSLVRQVSTLKTVILQIKQIEPNETVGYSRKFKAIQPTTIGIIPIGYADGLHRILGNGVGKLMVNGKLASIIGNICMDMCMIDLTGIEAREGDEVIVFGEAYPITEIARQMGTIPYEVLTSISRRVKRVYFQE
ncbi:MAG: bifunctional UDP-N-acetylmuramoyl-tripeptide:D-alanyl-D-alanine ligase/alanine racemase [Bacteroidota bacterium]|nr:bifunctional UDP-N-acetylmuramoyl-tripeptide:D-alanyl-D-alanine ligase/alanine racemase [Bacteroidota bacterium]